VLLGGAASPIVSNGEADVLISFEPLETLRILNKCNNKTLVITNAQPLPPFTVAVGQGKYPPVDEILDKVGKKVGKVVALHAMTWLRRRAMLYPQHGHAGGAHRKRCNGCDRKGHEGHHRRLYEKGFS